MSITLHQVKAQLQEKRFELPQNESTEVEINFCNETVYGKMNLLWVTGMVTERMMKDTTTYKHAWVQGSTRRSRAQQHTVTSH